MLGSFKLGGRNTWASTETCKIVDALCIHSDLLNGRDNQLPKCILRVLAHRGSPSKKYNKHTMSQVVLTSRRNLRLNESNHATCGGRNCSIKRCCCFPQHTASLANTSEIQRFAWLCFLCYFPHSTPLKSDGQLTVCTCLMWIHFNLAAREVEARIGHLIQKAEHNLKACTKSEINLLQNMFGHL